MKSKLFSMIGVLLCCVLLLPAAALAAADPPSTKENDALWTLTVSRKEDGENVINRSSTPCFWQTPLLGAGQSRSGGKMIFSNAGKKPVSITLDEISLPYDDDAQLKYLDSIILTVKQDGKTVYQGPYTHVMDPDTGLKIPSFELKSGEKREYEIGIHCAYTYRDDPVVLASPLDWTFTCETVEAAKGSSASPIIIVVACVCGAALLALILSVVLKQKK